MVEPFAEQLPKLRAERGWSRETLSHHAFRVDEEGTSVAQITAIERGERYPSAKTIAALAKALGIQPEGFAEYRLARARAALDERVVGLDRALEALSQESITEADLAARFDATAAQSLATDRSQAKGKSRAKRSNRGGA